MARKTTKKNESLQELKQRLQAKRSGQRQLSVTKGLELLNEIETKLMSTATLKTMDKPSPNRVARFNSDCPHCEKAIVANLSKVAIKREGEYGGKCYHYECYLEKFCGEDRGEEVPTSTMADLKPINDSLKKLHTRVSKVEKEQGEMAVGINKTNDRLEGVALELKNISDRLPQEHTIKVHDLPALKFNHAHFKLKDVVKFAAHRKWIYLYGEKGSGKSTMAKQAADALGLPYEYISLDPMSPASLVMGYMTPDGKYVESGFYRAYSRGGVFCVDEFDNASPSTLTLLNGALANSLAAFPCGPVPIHKDFVFIGTGNTDGRGPTFSYPERRKIGEATMDRVRHIHIPYDEALEANIALTLNPKAQPLIDYIRKIRKFIENPDNGIKDGIYATPRSIIEGASDLVLGESMEDIMEGRVFRGVNKAIKERILKAVGKP